MAEIVEALRELDADPAVDVIIVTRGGGSIEDLLPFSDETLIRAVAACRTPVVSAIGHEQDSPILDHVADVRASTPTDAARRVVPDVAEQLALIGQLRTRARRCLAGRLDREMSWLSAIRSRPVLANPVREIERQQELVTALTQRARRCLSASLDRASDDVSHVRARLIALSPAATLRRGYAIVQRGDSSVVRSAAEVAPDEALTVRFADDQLAVTAGRPSAETPGACRVHRTSFVTRATGIARNPIKNTSPALLSAAAAQERDARSRDHQGEGEDQRPVGPVALPAAAGHRDRAAGGSGGPPVPDGLMRPDGLVKPDGPTGPDGAVPDGAGPDGPVRTAGGRRSASPGGRPDHEPGWEDTAPRRARGEARRRTPGSTRTGTPAPWPWPGRTPGRPRETDRGAAQSPAAAAPICGPRCVAVA